MGNRIVKSIDYEAVTLLDKQIQLGSKVLVSIHFIDPQVETINAVLTDVEEHRQFILDNLLCMANFIAHESEASDNADEIRSVYGITESSIDPDIELSVGFNGHKHNDRSYRSVKIKNNRICTTIDDIDTENKNDYYLKMVPKSLLSNN